jgi:hypothetical protein
VLDEVSPTELRVPFIHIHQHLQAQGVLKAYQYLGGFLVNLDGTGHFSSSKINCADCCERHHRHGEVEYYHQLLGAVIVHPDKSEVLPLFPEAITRQEGARKNDGESNASKWLLPALREAFPQLPMIVVEDSLSADGSHIKLLKQLKYHYIIVVKPSDQPSLFEEVDKRQPFKGAPLEVTGEVAAHRGSLTQGGHFCDRLRLTPSVLVLLTTAPHPRRNRNPTQQRRWAVRGMAGTATLGPPPAEWSPR